MRHFFIFLYLIIGGVFVIHAQNVTINGIVVNENNQPLNGAHIHFENRIIHSDTQGYYTLDNLEKGRRNMTISYMGYKIKDTTIVVRHNVFIPLKLYPDVAVLQEVLIKQSGSSKDSANKIMVNQDYVADNFEGSLAKSLEKLPGINAIDIGSGASKPIIRGLGFNRVVVAENAIKQEGQQWGVDHGLEVDGLMVENVEIIKGVGSIEYGSDAIGGVIRIKNDTPPEKNTFSGGWTTIGRSVNQGITSSISLAYRKDQFFYKLKNTVSEYGDFNIPTNKIIYLTQQIPIYNGRLKNTAGKELNWFGQMGYVSEKFKTTFSISNVYQKSGFFPGSHGIPNSNAVIDDGNRRNIDLPYQNVNHFKVINSHEWSLDDSQFTILLSYQNNLRQEWSLFHTHYTGQIAPTKKPDLELEFQLNTYDGQIKYKKNISEKADLTFGIQGQWQRNTIGGYGFLLPKYRRNIYSVYATYRYSYSDKTTYHFGTRWDLSIIDIGAYFDPVLFSYLRNNGYPESLANQYAQRSKEVSNQYSNFNVMFGAVYELSHHWDFAVNMGTSFRVPTAIELAANGVHHGSFRHEQGDSNLDPEKGLVFDTKLNFNQNTLNIGLSPYVYYFDNYIFLNPSGQFSVLPEAGQIYKYSQTRAFITGVELEVKNTFFNKVKATAVLEYLYNRQINDEKSRNYPLPFTPPPNAFIELGYVFDTSKKLKNLEVFANTRMALEQNRIAQNEQITPGYILFGGGIKSDIHWRNFKLQAQLSVTNLLNTKYFNHISFYRAIELPEMGRNIQLMIRIPFTFNKNE